MGRARGVSAGGAPKRSAARGGLEEPLWLCKESAWVLTVVKRAEDGGWQEPCRGRRVGVIQDEWFPGPGGGFLEFGHLVKDLMEMMGLQQFVCY